MTYSFDRFSPQSFEQFVQTIAASKMGLTTQIFGAGKDGAREATFTGRIAINSAELWDGYIVVQAKHKETNGTSKENAAWLVRQIDTEFAKYQKTSRSLKTPNYYILASNTRLSAASANADGKGEGGVDLVERHLSKWAETLGIRKCTIWHADTLSTMLDSEPQIRANYSFWVTPGDVLSATLAQLKEEEIETCLPSFLRSQLRKSRDIKTKDAGQITGKNILLDDIFVDVPLSGASVLFEDLTQDMEDDSELVTAQHSLNLDSNDSSSSTSIDDEDDPTLNLALEAERKKWPATHTIIQRCSNKFDKPNTKVSKKCPESSGNHVVLMGGPGQGKSTVGQFIAQFYRARLLEQTTGNSPETEHTVKAILQRAEEEHIPAKGPARFPFFVDLPAYADALSKATRNGSVLTILSHITSQISHNDIPLKVSNLRRWLGAAPSIFILDGLDEIPHSSNRNDVIEAINGLVDVTYELSADAFILVTSRPQGYQNELSKRIWAHWDMANLSSSDAIRFGERLSQVLIPDDLRRLEINNDLIRASKEDATAPLMTSPLQVSLLFALLETRNNIPKDRWTLFYRYYEILRDREIAKGGENGQLIGQFRNEIDRLHYETGYLLHLRGESRGSASPFLALSELARIVERQLSKAEYDNISSLTERIVTLATTRLVFLRCRTAEQIAFDVRSLQEFMAAARLMASPEHKIKLRLREIAGRSHWFHVLKIACSKVYSSADLESLRDDVLAILDALDAGDRTPEDGLLRSGSLLAAQMLIDGVPGIAPASKRTLITRALGLLSTPRASAPTLLERAIDASSIRAIDLPLTNNLNTGGHYTRTSSLRLLLLLCHSQDASIANWAQQSWPGES